MVLAQTPVYQTLRPIAEELTGDRVVLRAYRRADAAALQAAIAESRDQLRPWESFAEAFQTLEETENWIIHRAAGWLVRERFTWGLWLREPGGYLGQVELWPRGPHGWAIPAFEMAYWVRQSAVGQGYATEAVRLLTDYAFTGLQAQRVELGIDAINRRSVALARRCGFVQEGRLRHTGIEEDGTLVDNLIFSLVPTDPRWTPTSGATATPPVS